MTFCLHSKRTEAIGLKRRKVYCDLRFGRFQSAGPVGLVISGPLAWARYLMVLMSTHGRDRTAKQTAHFMPGIQTRENWKYLGVILPGTPNFSQVLPLRGPTIPDCTKLETKASLWGTFQIQTIASHFSLLLFQSRAWELALTLKHLPYKKEDQPEFDLQNPHKR